MRADRLLSIILLLQVHRKMTACTLAQKLEVSERTIQRDMDALSSAGVPVIAERGAEGGWYLPDKYQVNLNGLNLNEMQTLLLPPPDNLLKDLGLADSAQAAYLKLIAALPAAQRQKAEYIRQRIYIDTTGWNAQTENLEWFSVLQEAIWQERKLNLIYRRNDETLVERLVDPLGLVAKGSVWYLVGAVNGEARTYRVSRLHSATLTDETGVRPTHFDLPAYWAQSAQEFKANIPRYPAVVRIDPKVLSHINYAWRYAQVQEIDEPDERGWLKLAVLFDVERVAAENVLSLSPFVEVLEPLELRERVVALARATLELYALSQSQRQIILQSAKVRRLSPRKGFNP
jgi:predicted DNA-binding transcriptional regulator YafY